MTKIAIFASGNGSNFQAIVDAIAAGDLAAEVKLLVCDQNDAYVIERAKQQGIDTFIFQAQAFSAKEEFERLILDELEERDVEYIVLAGYMRLIGHTLLDKYPNRIINIHPSLLPAFPGKDAIGQALAAKVKKTGVTIHYVDEGMDTGPIIAQKAIKVAKKDTKETLTQKIHAIEHLFYPKTLNKIFKKHNVQLRREQFK